MPPRTHAAEVLVEVEVWWLMLHWKMEASEWECFCAPWKTGTGVKPLCDPRFRIVARLGRFR